jgi:adenine phosphoribosyltransferase
LIPVHRDFKEGIAFRDVMPLLADPSALQHTHAELLSWARPLRPEYVAAVDARGFILGGALALALDCGFIAVRKRGRLPGPTIDGSFVGEYSPDDLELRIDLFPPGARILIHDDIMATGNCTRLTAQLVERAGGEVVGICSVVEKAFLGGRANIEAYPYKSVYTFHS